MKNIQCKTILTKSKLPGVDYCYNPYIGCTHGCKYCYAEFMKRFTGHSNEVWGNFIDYKENAVDVLKKEISKIKNEWVLIGSVTDAYQPIEKKLKLTRKSLEVFLQNNTSISILTKSGLVLRDIDFLSEFENCEVGITYAFSNQEIADILEPGSDILVNRINSIEKMKQQGINTYAFIGPIVPYLTNLEDIFKVIGKNINFAMAEILNLKSTNLSKLKKSLINILNEKEIEEILKLCIDKKYLKKLENEFNSLCEFYGVKNRGYFIHNIK
jgi:DNA repair photolyase